ncbi:MAG: PA4642 family protein [Porticoccaceae bacterium]
MTSAVLKPTVLKPAILKPATLKKDKQKILGEVFDDARIKTFLDLDAQEGVDADFHVLEKAYRGMEVENFATFLGFFIAAGRNLNATNPQGQTMLDILSTQAPAEAYLTALQQRLNQLNS